MLRQNLHKQQGELWLWLHERMTTQYNVSRCKYIRKKNIAVGQLRGLVAIIILDGTFHGHESDGNFAALEGLS